MSGHLNKAVGNFGGAQDLNAIEQPIQERYGKKGPSSRFAKKENVHDLSKMPTGSGVKLRSKNGNLSCKKVGLIFNLFHFYTVKIGLLQKRGGVSS